MLVHPKFGEVFILHTGVGNYQTGAVVSQKGKPIAYFSKKMNASQIDME